MEIIVYGSGGHAKVVADVVASAGEHRIVAFIDDTRSDTGSLRGCPVYPSLGDPALAGVDAGLVATVNSDDPAYFGGYMNDNFLQTFAATALTAAHAYQLARNSFEASFIDAARRTRYIDELDREFAGFA